jgi:uncharacterized protein YidB (DUF937 family)
MIDQIMSGALGYAQTTAVNNPLATVKMVMKFVQGYPGGMQALLSKLSESGLGDQVASWIGSGANSKISGDQVIDAFGAAHIQSVAQEFGMNQQQAATSIGELLPEVIDRLTPTGQHDPGEMARGFEGLRGKLHGL